jgi:protein subunit release factor A
VGLPTLYNLPAVIDGGLDPVINPLMTHDLETKLAALKV